MKKMSKKLIKKTETIKMLALNNTIFINNKFPAIKLIKPIQELMMR